MTADVEVVDVPSRQRFEARIGDRVAALDYRREGDRLVLLHTGVPEALEGRGIGGALVRRSVDHAREHQLTLVPRCPFASAWLRKHSDVAATVEVDWPAAA